MLGFSVTGGGGAFLGLTLDNHRGRLLRGAAFDLTLRCLCFESLNSL